MNVTGILHTALEIFDLRIVGSNEVKKATIHHHWQRKNFAPKEVKKLEVVDQSYYGKLVSHIGMGHVKAGISKLDYEK